MRRGRAGSLAINHLGPDRGPAKNSASTRERRRHRDRGRRFQELSTLSSQSSLQPSAPRPPLFANLCVPLRFCAQRGDWLVETQRRKGREGRMQSQDRSSPPRLWLGPGAKGQTNPRGNPAVCCKLQELSTLNFSTLYSSAFPFGNLCAALASLRLVRSWGVGKPGGAYSVPLTLIAGLHSLHHSFRVVGYNWRSPRLS